MNENFMICCCKVCWNDKKKLMFPLQIYINSI